MSKAEDAQAADFEQASGKLSDGLKSCRAIVRSYRKALASEGVAAAPPDEIERQAAPSEAEC